MQQDKVTIQYLQQYWLDLPAGTPLVIKEISQADNCYYCSVYESDEEIYTIPLNEGYIGEHHPQSKEVIGPFIPGNIIVKTESFSKRKKAKVFFKKSWPYIHAMVEVNSNSEAIDGTVYFGPSSDIIDADEFFSDIDSIIANHFPAAE